MNRQLNLNSYFSFDTRVFSSSLFTVTLFLIAFGILMVFSTTAPISNEQFGTTSHLLKKHLMHIALGVVFMCFFLFFNLELLRKYSSAILIFSIFLLVLVLFPTIGRQVGGARRWLDLAFFRFQPAELAKLSIVIFFSSYIFKYNNIMGRFVPGVLVPLLITAFFGFLLLLEPDFGSTSIILLVVFAQLSLASKIRHLLVVGAVAASCLFVALYTSPYRMKRVTSYLSPFDDPANSGYQLIQSLIAVGSGGVKGSGLGIGSQKLFYLPAAHTDFIYAVAAEELGFIGAISILSAFLFFAYKGFQLVYKNLSDPFLSSLALGSTLLIICPALLNIGVVIGLLPTKGLVLPFISSGGSAMLVHLATIGVLLNISKRTFEKS